MKVKIAERVWSMSKVEYKGLLNLASEQVPFGIYALEKKGYAELCNVRVRSISDLKKKIREYKEAGFKVYANRR